MTHRVGAKGQVVIPKEIREKAGIGPGDEIEFEEVDGMVSLRKAKTVDEILDELQGCLADSDLDVTEMLMEERRHEREREDRKLGGLR